MGANKTRRGVRTSILAAPVRDYASWTLMVSCAPCARQRMLPIADLPQEGLVRDVVRRLRCQECGGVPSMIAVDNRLPGWRANIVQLWGAGSYG